MDNRAHSVGSTISPGLQIVVLLLDSSRYGLRLSSVERIVQIVEISPLPKAPEIVLGVVNVRGEIVPVIDVRKRFRLPERKLKLSDQLVIASTSKRKVALVVDAVAGLAEFADSQITAAQGILSNLDYIEGVCKMADGLLLIHDLETFLSLEEEKKLQQALPQY